MRHQQNQPNEEFNKNKFGFYISIFTAVLTVITFGVAVCTPPLSGPFCPDSCFQYPYSDIASRFPRDYYWMYPAIIVSLSYLVFMVSMHHYSPAGKKLYSQIGVSFAVIAAMVLSVNYFVQVTVIPPSLLNGETDGIVLLTQFNPHGLFIALEEIGFLIISVSFLCMVPVFSRATGLEKALRWTFIISFLIIIGSLILVSLQHGVMREYRFEVIVITITWLELIIAGILMARIFKKTIKGNA